MNFSALILVAGYLLLAIGSSPVQTEDCFCHLYLTGEKRIEKTILISMMREDVVNVTCINEKATNRDFMWKAIGESKELDVTHRSGHAHVLTIKGTSINATRSEFVCRLKNDTNKGNLRDCCTAIAEILPERAKHKSNSSYANTATISATVSATAVLLLSVGAAVAIALKRKRLSNKFTASDSSDNLLNLNEQQVWNGSKIIPIDCLLIGKLLGEGQFGTVTEGKIRTVCKQRKIHDRRIAIKMLKNREGVNAEELQKEAELLVKLGQHENVIHVYGYCIEEKCLSRIVMEYAEQGDLHRHLRKLRSVGLDDGRQFLFAQQIAKGMNFVVTKGCVHRDLAARNVLVCAGQRLKISDFGLAKDLQSATYYRKTSRGGVIPFRWCAPEVLLYATYSEYSDVWSYGIVLWEIATMGGTPYPGIPVEKLFELLTGKSGYRMTKPRNCSQKLYDIMVSCWNSVPDKRPTFLRISSKNKRVSDVQYIKQPPLQSSQ